MEKVPRMRNCRAAWHALEGDLVWWARRTLDRYLVEEGFATVKLPKK